MLLDAAKALPLSERVELAEAVAWYEARRSGSDSK